MLTRVEPKPGQESVWDYPRPPRIEPTERLVEVFFKGHKIAETRNAKRVLETSHPPVFYIPAEDVVAELLQDSNRRTFCEYKGTAVYHTIAVGDARSVNAAWSYPDPVPDFESIRDHLAFYPSRVDACLVDGERVQAQEGDFYGGWITREIVGPFKGGDGTWGW